MNALLAYGLPMFVHSLPLNTDGGKFRDHSLFSGGKGICRNFRGLKPFFYSDLQKLLRENFSQVIYEQSVEIVI